MDTQTPTQQTLREGSVSSRIIEPEPLYDPLLVLLKVKLRLNNWWIFIGMGIPLVASLLFTDLFTLFQRLALSVMCLLVMGIYLSLPSTIADLFNRLWENEVIGNGHANTLGSLSYMEFVEKQARWIHSRWWAAIALFASPLNHLFFVLGYPGLTPEWIRVPLWLQLILIFSTLVISYVCFLASGWFVMITVSTHRLFRTFTIRVKPLHPDGSGGLGIFNRLLWISIPVVMLPAFFSSVFGGSVLQGLGATILFSNFMVYLLIATLPLRAWLVLPHQVMVQARNKLLQPLTNEYERALGETMSGTLGDTTVINEGTERLIALQKRYEQVRNSFPTWPIEIAQLRGLVTLLILPVLLALLPLLVDLFTKK
jgi:hypothetical protein